MDKKVILIIMDGFGISKHQNKKTDAIAAASTPNLDFAFKTYPFSLLKASEEAVGLPKGQMGNSEVGHTNIGAGRVIEENLVRINNSIKDKTFFKNPSLLNSLESAKKNNSRVHLIGLLSNGGIHSHIDHLFALLKMCKEQNLKGVYIHALLDGRDTPPTSGVEFVKKTEDFCNKLGIGKIASLAGRYYGMDRDNRWDRTEMYYNVITNSSSISQGSNGIATVVTGRYAKNITDEFIRPVLLNKDFVLQNNDSVIFFNFRSDRVRQLTSALTEPNFNKFKRKTFLKNLHFTSFTQYDQNYKNVEEAFKPLEINNTLTEFLSKQNKRVLKIAETEKYAHVTFFFNGGIEKKYPGESRMLIPSPKVTTYDLAPKMSAHEITDAVTNNLSSCLYDVVICNFANCDMVGHTGNFKATINAVETLDKCVGEILSSAQKYNYSTIVTSDHGNADQMLDNVNEVITSHSLNPVPCCIANYPCKGLKNGVISGIAPTILEILGLPKPEEMIAESLIIH